MASLPVEGEFDNPEVSHLNHELSTKTEKKIFVYIFSKISKFLFSFQFEEADLDLDQIEQDPTQGRKRLFSKELRCMMFGFGDDQNPYTESVDLLEGEFFVSLLWKRQWVLSSNSYQKP